jgi:PIN domain nuclease of toxin-antitoxin system
VARDAGAAAAANGIALLPVTLAHAEAAGRLPRHHRDPFDRLLVAQSLLEGLTLVSADTALDAFGVTRLW